MFYEGMVHHLKYQYMEIVNKPYCPNCAQNFIVSYRLWFTLFPNNVLGIRCIK